VRDQAIDHGIGGGVDGGVGDGSGRPDPVTEPIGRIGPPAPAPEEPGGWRGALRDNLAFALVLIVGIVGIVLILLYHWRRGAVLIGAALLLAALFRVLLPDRRAGLLVVRGRPVDVLSYTALGACVVSVAVTITGGPFG
jgi:hypothetical protein